VSLAHLFDNLGKLPGGKVKSEPAAAKKEEETPATVEPAEAVGHPG